MKQNIKMSWGVYLSSLFHLILYQKVFKKNNYYIHNLELYTFSKI